MQGSNSIFLIDLNAKLLVFISVCMTCFRCCFFFQCLSKMHQEDGPSLSLG